MKFVTKKEFDDAVLIVQAALKSGQIIDGYGKSELDSLLFSNHAIMEQYKLGQIIFVAPDLAAKDRLHSIRQTLKRQREETNKNQKELEDLESKEQKLAKLLPTLKE